MSNGTTKFLVIERAFILLILASNLFLAILSILTKFEHSNEAAEYFRMLISCHSTVFFWLPFSFIFFYLFSPSNYHLGKERFFFFRSIKIVI